jgi:hypothetical protein
MMWQMLLLILKDAIRHEMVALLVALPLLLWYLQVAVVAMNLVPVVGVEREAAVQIVNKIDDTRLVPQDAYWDYLLRLDRMPSSLLFHDVAPYCSGQAPELEEQLLAEQSTGQRYD